MNKELRELLSKMEAKTQEAKKYLDGENKDLEKAQVLFDEAEEFKKEIAEVFPGIEIVQNPLSLSVACHIGHGAIAVACSRKVVVE